MKTKNARRIKPRRPPMISKIGRPSVSVLLSSFSPAEPPLLLLLPFPEFRSDVVLVVEIKEEDDEVAGVLLEDDDEGAAADVVVVGVAVLVVVVEEG